MKGIEFFEQLLQLGRLFSNVSFKDVKKIAEEVEKERLIDAISSTARE